MHALNVAEHTGLLCALVCCILRSVFGCERNELTAVRFGSGYCVLKNFVKIRAVHETLRCDQLMGQDLQSAFFAHGLATKIV